MLENNKLPNFLIIGAAKSGTTSLHEYLSQHPEVFMSSPKEPHYFADIPKNTKGGYYGANVFQNFDEYKQIFENSCSCKIIGESSVTTLYYPNAIDKAVEILGSKIKVLIILRNPVDRAYSNYMHHVRDMNEPLSFEEALAAENKRKEENFWWGYQLKSAGLYAKQIRHIYKFLPKENVKILLFEEFKKDIPHFMKEICEFVNISKEFKFNISFVSNKSGRPNNNRLLVRLYNVFKNPESNFLSFLKRNSPSNLKRSVQNIFKSKIIEKNLVQEKMNELTREKLLTYYKKDISDLEKILNRNLNIWKK